MSPAKEISVREHERRKPHKESRTHVDRYVRKQEINQSPAPTAVDLGQVAMLDMTIKVKTEDKQTKMFNTKILTFEHNGHVYALGRMTDRNDANRVLYIGARDDSRSQLPKTFRSKSDLKYAYPSLKEVIDKHL
jgi:hypothetical protein